MVLPRRYQFSIRSLLVAMVVVAIAGSLARSFPLIAITLGGALAVVLVGTIGVLAEMSAMWLLCRVICGIGRALGTSFHLTLNAPQESPETTPQPDPEEPASRR